MAAPFPTCNTDSEDRTWAPDRQPLRIRGCAAKVKPLRTLPTSAPTGMLRRARPGRLRRLRVAPRLSPQHSVQSCQQQCGNYRHRFRQCVSHDCLRLRRHRPPLNRRGGSKPPGSPAAISRTLMPQIRPSRTARGRPRFSHPTHRWCTPATAARGCDRETVRGEQSQSINALACRKKCDHFARMGLRGDYPCGFRGLPGRHQAERRFGPSGNSLAPARARILVARSPAPHHECAQIDRMALGPSSPGIARNRAPGATKPRRKRHNTGRGLLRESRRNGKVSGGKATMANTIPPDPADERERPESLASISRECFMPCGSRAWSDRRVTRFTSRPISVEMHRWLLSTPLSCPN